MRNLFILRGAPASGKSTWITENNLESYTLSADGIRLMYQSPITTPEGELSISQNHDKEVWALLLDLLEKRMRNGVLVIVDATHYKSSLISRYKDLVSKYRYRVYVVDFTNITEEELLRRNANRGFRKVPDEVISKMVVALADSGEVKKAYKIISPDEAIKMIEEPLKPFDANEFEKVVVIGDIHGCYEPLKKYFDMFPFSENINYIFTGDYLDRGLQNKEVLEFLIGLKDYKNVVFLEGNHDSRLRVYASKDYNIEDYIPTKKEYEDLYVRKLIAQLKDKLVQYEKKVQKNKNICQELSDKLNEVRNNTTWENDEDIPVEVFYHFEKVNVPERQKELNQENVKLNRIINKIEQSIHYLTHEANNTKNTIDEIVTWFKENAGFGFSFNINGLLEREYNVTSNKVDNPIKSAEFLNNTYPQIKDIDKADIRRLSERFIAMSYITYKGKNYFISHGGVPCLPTLKTQAIELIKGVGKYEDHVAIDNQFNKNTDTIQIHGHRNVMRVPVITNNGQTINLEGQVEFGGNLRIVEIMDQVNVIEIKNNIYKKEEEVVIDEHTTDLEILNQMWDSKWVQVKELNDNVLSFNFTRDAFEKDKWNTLTCHARGLFVDSTNGNIVARSFSKFFNRNQVDETKSPALKQNFKYPVIGYKKENGFLGIVSKYNDKIYFFTKSSDSGDFVNWFIGALCDNYGIKPIWHVGSNEYFTYTRLYNDMIVDKKEYDYKLELTVLRNQLIDKLNPLLEEGYSYVFECIDTVNDPHIIKYDSSKVVLLEVFKNQLKEEHVSWKELHEIADRLNVPVKQKELEFNNWEEFEEWKNKFTTGITQWDCKHEGYVFEDANGFRVKCKSTFYSWWKQMRNIKEAIQNGRENRKIYKTKEEIQVVKLMEELGRDKLSEMSIIDVEDLFYSMYNEEEKAEV